MNKLAMIKKIQVFIYNELGLSIEAKEIERLFDANKIYIFNNKEDIFNLLSGNISLDNVEEMKEEIHRLINIRVKKEGNNIIDELINSIDEKYLNDRSYEYLLINDVDFPNFYVLFDYDSIDAFRQPKKHCLKK